MRKRKTTAREPVSDAGTRAPAAEPFAIDFASRHEAALREAAHPDIDADTRVLVIGLLSELQQIRTALDGMRDGESSE